LLKHFDTVKKHLLECPQISELFDEDEAEDEAEDMDMFDNEALEQLVGDSDDEEEEQVPSEDEDIEDDSDDETSPAKPAKKVEQKPAANGKPATPKAALKAPIADSSDDEEAEDDEEEDEDESEMEIDLPTPKSAQKPTAIAKPGSTPGKKQHQKPISTPATAGKKRPQPSSESLVKKVNLKDEKSLQAATPAKKAKIDDSAKGKKPATSSKFFVEHESEEDSDDDAASDDDDSDDEKKTFPSKKKADDGQTKGFWKGKVAGDKKEHQGGEKRGGFVQRGGRGGDRG
uniref:Uncharacterized protein n=1 Tax=Panagrolaimus sp. ES5 TaxID=591445 RepID=A0AC34GGN7_9BILA